MGKNVGHKGGPSHASEEKKKKQDLVFYDYLRPFPAGYLFIGRCISKRKNIGRIRHPFVIRLSWCQSTLQHEFHLSFDLIFLSSRIFSSVVSVSFPLLNLVMACNHFDIFSSFASRWWLSFACLFFFFQSRRFVFGLGGFFPVFFHSEDVALFPLILFFWNRSGNQPKKHFSFLQRVLIWCLCRPGQHSIGLKQVRLDGCLLFVCFDPIHSSMFPTARTFHARTVCKSFTRVCFWFNLVCLFVYPIIGFYTLYSSLVFFFSLSLLPPTGT